MESLLLSTFEKKDISDFRKDLLQILRIAKNADKYYVQSNADLDAYFDKFSSLVEAFNKKYKGIKLKMKIKTNEVDLKMYLSEKSVSNCFANCASKVIGLQAVGSSKFGAAGISDTAAFTNEIERIKEKLYTTYYNPETGHSNVFLHYDSKEKNVEIAYSFDDVSAEQGPEFQIAAFYALREGVNKNIDIQGTGSTLGFSFIPSHAEKAEHFRKFDRHIAE